MLRVEALCTDYRRVEGPPVRAIEEVSFEVPQGKFFTLLGPSGCGKTTTLRSIAGLERPTGGEISAGGEVVYSSRRGIFVPPNRRGFGMVFQSYAIWPHMDVFSNVAFPLRVARARHSRAEIERRTMTALETVQLERLREREATTLSGGEQQRLALARALVMEPRLLLLDEPLSNLDARLREQMRFEIKRLQRALRITTVYVTHDQGEALALSHRIAVMSEGRIRQVGTPREIYERPGDRFVAEFVGATNFLPGTVVAMQAGGRLCSVRTQIGDVLAGGADAVRAGEEVVLTIRPEHVLLSERQPEGANVWRAVVQQKVFLGEATDFRLRIGERVIQSRAHASLRTRIGEPLWVRLDHERCVLIPA